MLAALVRFMKTRRAVAYPLRVMEKVAEHDKVLEIVDERVRERAAGLHAVRQAPHRPPQVVREWKDATDDEVISRVKPYVADFDEVVRFTAIEGLGSRDLRRSAIR